MPEDATGQQVANQGAAPTGDQAGQTAGAGAGGATPPVGEPQGGQANPDLITPAQSAPAQGQQAVEFGPKDLPKELEPFKKQLLDTFYAKTRELAGEKHNIDAYKQKAEMLAQLVEYKPFQDWYAKEQGNIGGGNGNQPQPQVQFTDEQITAAGNDPAKLLEMVNQTVDSRVAQQMSQLNQTVGKTQKQLEDMSLDKELAGLEAKYSDFGKISQSGLLDTYLDQGLSYKSAYAQFRLDNPQYTQAAIAKEATALVNQSKDGVTGKPSGLPNLGAKILKPRSLEEGISMSFNAVEKGEKIRLEKPEQTR